MGEALARDPAAAAVMGGLPEITMAYRDDRTGLWVLSRPDTVSFDGAVSDYKKVSTQGRPFTHRLVDARISQHGYHQQMALAADALEVLTGNRPETVGLVFQCDKPPYHVVLRGVGEEALSIGRFQNNRALIRFAECLESGRWPGPGEDVAEYQMHPAMRERLLEEMQQWGTAP